MKMRPAPPIASVLFLVSLAALSVAQPVSPPTNQSASRAQYDAFMASAAAFERIGETGKAIEALRQAMLAAPDDQTRAEVANAIHGAGTDKAEYVSHLAAARAYARRGDDDKAIESYREAVLAAQIDADRSQAEAELNEYATLVKSIPDSGARWLLEVMKWPIGVFVAFGLLGLFGALVLWFLGWLCRWFDSGRLTVRSNSPDIPGDYVVGCMKAVYFDLQRQPVLMANVAQLSANTSAAPTPLSIATPSNLNVGQVEPIVLEKGWVSILWRFHRDLFERARSSFSVELNAMKCKEAIGMVLTLTKRERKCLIWSRWSIAGRWYVPSTCADMSTGLNDALYLVALVVRKG